MLHPGKCQRRIYQATGQSGTIESPGYPKDYSPLQTCIWRISVNMGYRVHIHFDSHFDVTRTPACKDEYVLVSTRRQRFSDFNVVRNSRDSVVFCGNQKPSNVSSPANEMWVRFKARSGGRKGFRAWYGAEGKSFIHCSVTVQLQYNNNCCVYFCFGKVSKTSAYVPRRTSKHPETESNAAPNAAPLTHVRLVKNLSDRKTR